MVSPRSARRAARVRNGDGLDELSADIDAMIADLEASLPEIVMTAAEVIEAEIRQRAPVDTGALVRSLDSKADRRKGAASATVQMERSGPDGTEHYAIFQEFGTSKMAARPFFRPGVEAAAPKVQELVSAQILAQIETYDQ
jgi:HK97 gp10 family phage protein